MKYVIASDIHGGADCCRRLLERFEAEKADRLLLLGDLLYHGPRNNIPEDYQTKEVFAMLNEYKEKIFAVRGNCDAEVDQMVLEFPIMETFLPLYDSGLILIATHGHIYDELHLPKIPDIDVILCGHTHVPALRDHGSYVYMNPGSVTLPLGGSAKGYMTMENGVFEWKTLGGGTWRRFERKPRR